MGLFEKAREELILRPLAQYLISRNQEAENMEKASGFRGSIREGYTLAQRQGPVKKKPGSTVDFAALRRFSVQYDVARACINRRKRQIGQLEWSVVPAVGVEATPSQNEVLRVNRELRDLGGYQVRFRELLDVMIEDLLVLDAVVLEKRKRVNGGFFGLLPVDASTIELRVDTSGGTPEPPEIAYRQWINGQNTANWTADEMYYEMMNPRTNTPYGLSPLESLVIGVATALKSDLYNLHMLTEGNIPEGFFYVPEGWSTKQIREYQEIWDAMLAGNTEANSRIKFVPDSKKGYEPAVKASDMKYRELQEWLMKKTCMLFEIQPQELGFTETVNRATGEVQEGIGERSGLIPLAQFLEEIFTDVLQKDMGYDKLQFKFTGLEEKNEREIAETNEVLIRSGQRTIDELREADGLKKIGVDKPIFAGTYEFIDEESLAQRQETAEAIADAKKPVDNEVDDKKEEVDEEEETQKSVDPHVALVSDLRAYRKHVIYRMKHNRKPRAFNSDVLPEATVAELNKRVANAATLDEAKAVFSEYMRDYQVKFIADVLQLKQATQKVLDEPGRKNS